jgi:hypothetical protein
MTTTPVLAMIAACAFATCIPNSSLVAQPTDAGQSTSASEPALYVVDSQNTLHSFGDGGTPLRTMQFNAEIGTLNGGITLAMGNLYVTWVKPANDGNIDGDRSGVFAYDRITLRQVRLHIGAFKLKDAALNPGAMHSIVYDPHSDRFYVATDRLGLLAFDRAGGYIPRAPESTLSVSSAAYDPTHHSLWGIVGRHAVVQFSEDGNGPLTGFPATGPRYRHGHGALALAYCAIEGRDAGPLDAVAVTFAEAKAGSRGVGTGQTFDPAGKSIGSPYGTTIVNPHGMACSSRGEVFIAADNGLLEYTFQGSSLNPSVYSQGLSGPIYGVLAAY